MIRFWFLILPFLALMCTGGVATAGPGALSVSPIEPRLLNGMQKERRARELMATCYDSIFMWHEVVDARIQPVPDKPGCLYLGGNGNEENDVRPVAYASLVHAFVAEMEGPGARLSRERRNAARDKSIAMMKYLVQAHVVGTSTCVNGKKWGNQWQSAMWARSLGLAAWLLWDDLPPDLQAEIIKLIAFEADRFVAAQPKSSVRNDTGAEENAWNAQILSLAACLLPNDRRSKAWADAAKRWMYNTLSVQQDQQDTFVGDDGRPINEWVNTTNVHSDFTIENHGIVHIGYLKTSASLLVENAVPYLLAGREVPAAAMHHARECFEVMLRCMGWDGSAIYISGNDWKLFHSQSTDAMFYGFMSLLGHDPRGAHLEEVALDYTLRIQKSENGFYNMRRDLEFGGLSAARLISAYLAHAALGAPTKPLSKKEFNRDVSGVFYFPEANFVVHRTPAKFVSASLSQKRMLLALPENGSWVAWPHFASIPGYINGQDASSRHAKLLRSQIETNSNGFQVTGVLSRANGSIEQSFVYRSLGNDTVVYVERLRGQGFKSREGGVVGIEYDIGSNSRRIFTSRGRKDITGFGGDAPKVHSLRTDWLNIDNRVGYIVKRLPAQTNVMRYHDEIAGSGRVPKLEEWVSLVGEEDSSKLSGEEWLCVVTALNQKAGATERLLKKTHFTVRGQTATCRIGDDELHVSF